MAVWQITEYAQPEETAGILNAADIIDDLRQPLEATARESLARALDTAADALFTRARREGKEPLRSNLHSAVHSLRQHRKAIDERFRQVLDQCFQQGFNSPAQAPLLQRRTLASREDVKDNMVIHATARRVRNEQQANLDELEGLLCQAVRVDPTGENNPFDPLILIRAFGEALAEANIETRPRLVVYRAFEDQLTSSLSTAYRTLITELKAAGVTASTASATGSVADAPVTEATADTASASSAYEYDSVVEHAVNRSDGVVATTAHSHGASCADELSADAEDKLNLARQHVRLVVESRLGREPHLPDEVCRFLRQAWSDVMLVNGFRYGVNSKYWQEHKRILESLIGTMRPHPTAADRESSEQKLPKVLEQVQEKLNAVMSDGEIVSELVDHLLDVYIHTNGAPGAEPGPSPDTEAPVAKGDGPSDPILVGDDSDGASHGGTVDQNANDDNAIRRELTTAPIGGSLEFIGDDGGPQGSRVHAGLDREQHYIVADRHGAKVTEYSTHDVAEGYAAPVNAIVMPESDEKRQEG